MRSKVVLCVSVSVCPGLASATHATRHTYGLSIVLAPELIWRFSYNGLVSKIAIALPYSRAHGSWPFLYEKRLIFRIPSVYYARDFTRAVNLYAHVQRIALEQSHSSASWPPHFLASAHSII